MILQNYVSFGYIFKNTNKFQFSIYSPLTPTNKISFQQHIKFIGMIFIQEILSVSLNIQKKNLFFSLKFKAISLTVMPRTYTEIL